MKKLLFTTAILLASVSLKAQTFTPNGWVFNKKPDTIIVTVNGNARKAVIRQKSDTVFVETLRNFTPYFKYDQNGNIYILNYQTGKTIKLD